MLRQSGKHLILVQGRRDRVKRFKADEMVGKEVVVFAAYVCESSKKKVRNCKPGTLRGF